MLNTNFKDFRKKAKKNKLVPVVEALLADLETPVSALIKLTRGCRDSRCFLLESVEGGEQVGRYSYLGTDPLVVLETQGKEAILTEGNKKTRYRMQGDPLHEVDKLMKRYRPGEEHGLPDFGGGAVGYLSYDCVRFWEATPDSNPEVMGFPESVHFIADTLVAFDHVAHSMKIIALARIDSTDSAKLKAIWQEALQRIARIRRRLSGPLPRLAAGPKTKKNIKVKWKSNVSRAKYMGMVEKTKAYIRAGDIFQVEVGRRLHKSCGVHAFDIYRQMRCINPSPFMYYFQDGPRRLVGASPEILVKSQGRRGTIRPIAGTRSRGKTPQEDLALEKELLGNAKERAEHIMMVDLARNDIGRVCTAGSVHVTDLMVVERYSHVMHIVSDVEGELLPGLSSAELVRASFPAGTMSGAPKVRGMEVIDELENERRGPYAGCLGFYGFNGDLSTALLIRTLFVNGSDIYAQAAAGIVADSQPQAEFDETEKKMRAVIKAVEFAEAAGDKR